MTTAPARWLRSRGFTLVELLIVMAVIGVITALVMFRTGPTTDFRRAESSVNTLYDLLLLANEESALTGRDIGVLVQPDSFAFMVVDAGSWSEINGDPLLSRRALPFGLEARLAVEGLPVDLYADASELEPVPQMIMLTSGELTPFELRLAHQELGFGWVIRGEWDGTITLERSDEGSA